MGKTNAIIRKVGDDALREAIVAGVVQAELKEALIAELERRAVESTLKCQLLPDSPEAMTLLTTLEQRLTSESVYRRPGGIEWTEVRIALEARPDLMWSLAQMENSGGAVDIRAVEGDEFIFCDFSQETPEERRSLTYDQMEERAEEMGVDIQSEAGWRALQTLGVFDEKGWVWLKSDDIMDTGEARIGIRFGHGVRVTHRPAVANKHPNRGWRAELRVPKVK